MARTFVKVSLRVEVVEEKQPLRGGFLHLFPELLETLSYMAAKLSKS